MGMDCMTWLEMFGNFARINTTTKPISKTSRRTQKAPKAHSTLASLMQKNMWYVVVPFYVMTAIAVVTVSLVE